MYRYKLLEANDRNNLIEIKLLLFAASFIIEN